MSEGIETPREREDKASRLEFERGRRQQEINSRLDDHDRQLRSLAGSTMEIGTRMSGVEKAILTLGDKMERREEVASALAEASKELAAKQVSTRTFLLGLVGAVTAIGALLASSGHA